MTRNLSSPQQTAVAGGHRQIAPLVELYFDSGTLYFTLAPFDITSGAITYIHTGALAYIRPPTESTNSVEGLEVGVSALDPAAITIAASEPYRGRLLKLLKGILDPTTSALVGNPVPWYVGRMVNMIITETSKPDGGGSAGGQADIAIITEHYDAQLDRATPIRWSDSDQQRFFPGDLGCQYTVTLPDKVVVFPSKEAQT